MKKNKKENFKMGYACAMGISNNWRKIHHYPMRKRYQKRITYPCNKLQGTEFCVFPFC